jgi:hypothetical protein
MTRSTGKHRTLTHGRRRHEATRHAVQRGGKHFDVHWLVEKSIGAVGKRTDVVVLPGVAGEHDNAKRGYLAKVLDDAETALVG